MRTRQLVNVIRPGVIVSTIVENGHVETVTFTAGLDRRPFFDVRVQRSDDAGDAVTMHALAAAVA